MRVRVNVYALKCCLLKAIHSSILGCRFRKRAAVSGAEPSLGLAALQRPGQAVVQERSAEAAAKPGLGLGLGGLGLGYGLGGLGYGLGGLYGGYGLGGLGYGGYG